jgi:hypothetical protein
MFEGVILALLLTANGAAQGLLGTNLEDAKRTDFFKFFNLKETGAYLALQKNVVVGFKPEGPSFRELVSVNVTLDTNKTIVGIDLILVRSFVDHKTNGIFARDIAKSLLRSAIPEEDQKAIADLANEIEFPPAAPGQTILTVRPPPKLPNKPTAGYLVYLGKQSLFEQTMSACKLRLENHKAEANDSLMISITSK